MTLTRDHILGKLRNAGVAVDPGALRIESRKGRTVAHLDGGRIGWFPEHAEAGAGVANERRILRLIERHCRYRAPRVIHEDPEGWDVRTIVPGVPAQDYLEQVKTDPGAARRTGATLGLLLADQHTRIPVSQLEGWLTPVPPWPEQEALANLPRVTGDSTLLARIGRALDRRDAMARELADPALVHSDPGPWNLACDAATGEVNGVFDYGDAFLGDRHCDFKYFQFYRPDEQAMLDAAIAAYETETAIRLDRDRIRFFNAIEAIGFLGFRYGHPPEEKWCGRTLAEDLEWTDISLRSVGL
jgi:aminoglycoside phosphotransferase (APT) family kinase protein